MVDIDVLVHPALVSRHARTRRATWYISSVSSSGLFQYTPARSGRPFHTPLSEDSPLEAHTYLYGMHKRECDEVVQQRAPSLGGCSVYILRPHIFAGPSVDIYLVGIFRGTPNGKSRVAAKLRARRLRLPCVLPFGEHYLQNRVQYVHIDDVARLIAHILRRGPEEKQLTILNVAGRADPLTIARCIEISGCKVIRVPGQWACKPGLRLAWRFGISAIPPEITPYMTGQCIMTTDFGFGRFLARSTK